MFKENHKDKAKVVDGKLILSFPNAIKPVVWQMDLAQAKASALEVNDNDGKEFSLVLKTPKGETINIAPFEKKEQAINGLMAASKALEKAQGHIHVTSAAQTNTANTARPHKKSGLPKGLLLIIGGLAIIFILINTLSSLGLQAPNSANRLQNTAASNINETGIPLSADEFLQRR